MICPKCGKFLLAREGILQAGKKYHRHCWTCARCSSPLNSWARQQAVGNEYLCNNCHIRINGLKEGLIFVNWQKHSKSTASLKTQSSTMIDDILLI